jgi:cytoskeletal protein CcmA (bactofilin family)
MAYTPSSAIPNMLSCVRSWRGATFLGLVLATLMARASDGRPGTHEAIIDGDYFGAGEAASPAQPVEGDAFIVSPYLNLIQPVKGDVLVAGNGVTISGPVGGDVYGMGGRVLLETTVARNVRIAAGRVEIGMRGEVSGKTTLTGGRVTVLGKAGHQLSVFAEHVTLDGEIDGNVTIAARTLTVGPHTKITGRLTYRGSVPAQRDPAAIITGGMNYLSYDFEEETFQPIAKVLAWLGAIAFTVGLFVIGTFAIILKPDWTERMTRLGRHRPMSSLGLGAVAIVCLPIAIVLLMLSIVGIPLALMLLMAWPMILLLGYLAGVMTLSDAIAGPNSEAKGRRVFVLAMALGVMLLFARVPMAGWGIGMLLVVLGIGAMALLVMGAIVPGRTNKKSPPGTEATTSETSSRQEPTFRNH